MFFNVNLIIPLNIGFFFLHSFTFLRTKLFLCPHSAACILFWKSKRYIGLDLTLTSSCSTVYNNTEIMTGTKVWNHLLNINLEKICQYEYVNMNRFSWIFIFLFMPWIFWRIVPYIFWRLMYVLNFTFSF